MVVQFIPGSKEDTNQGQSIRSGHHMFVFKANPPEETFQITKQNFLKKIATLFDLIGFLAPFTIRAKVMMQEKWVAGLEWDELCPRELIHKSQEWFCELEDRVTND